MLTGSSAWVIVMFPLGLNENPDTEDGDLDVVDYAGDLAVTFGGY